jgi:hypothetical protein
MLLRYFFVNALGIASRKHMKGETLSRKMQRITGSELGIYGIEEFFVKRLIVNFIKRFVEFIKIFPLFFGIEGLLIFPFWITVSNSSASMLLPSYNI